MTSSGLIFPWILVSLPRVAAAKPTRPFPFLRGFACPGDLQEGSLFGPSSTLLRPQVKSEAADRAPSHLARLDDLPKRHNNPPPGIHPQRRPASAAPEALRFCHRRPVGRAGSGSRTGTATNSSPTLTRGRQDITTRQHCTAMIGAARARDMAIPPAELATPRITSDVALTVSSPLVSLATLEMSSPGKHRGAAAETF